MTAQLPVGLTCPGGNGGVTEMLTQNRLGVRQRVRARVVEGAITGYSLEFAPIGWEYGLLWDLSLQAPPHAAAADLGRRDAEVLGGWLAVACNGTPQSAADRFATLRRNRDIVQAAGPDANFEFSETRLLCPDANGGEMALTLRNRYGYRVFYLAQFDGATATRVQVADWNPDRSAWGEWQARTPQAPRDAEGFFWARVYASTVEASLRLGCLVSQAARKANQHRIANIATFFETFVPAPVPYSD